MFTLRPVFTFLSLSLLRIVSGSVDQCRANEQRLVCSSCERFCAQQDDTPCVDTCHPERCVCEASKGLRINNLNNECVPISECPSEEELLASVSIPRMPPPDLNNTLIPPNWRNNVSYVFTPNHNLDQQQDEQSTNGSSENPHVNYLGGAVPPNVPHPTPHKPLMSAPNSNYLQERSNPTDSAVYPRQLNYFHVSSARFINPSNQSPQPSDTQNNGYQNGQYVSYLGPEKMQPTSVQGMPRNGIEDGRTYGRRQAESNSRYLQRLNPPRPPVTSNPLASNPYVGNLGPQTPTTSNTNSEGTRLLYTRQAASTPYIQHLGPPRLSSDGSAPITNGQYVSFLGPEVHPTAQAPPLYTTSDSEARTFAVRQADTEAYSSASASSVHPHPRIPPLYNSSNPYTDGQYVGNLGPATRPTRGPNPGFQIPRAFVTRDIDSLNYNVRHLVRRIPSPRPYNSSNPYTDGQYVGNLGPATHPTRGPNPGFQIPGSPVARDGVPTTTTQK